MKLKKINYLKTDPVGTAPASQEQMTWEKK